MLKIIFYHLDLIIRIADLRFYFNSFSFNWMPLRWYNGRDNQRGRGLCRPWPKTEGFVCFWYHFMSRREVRIALKFRFHIQQPYPTTNKSLRFWPRPWTLAPFDDLSKWRVFFTFATSIFLTVRPGFLEVKHFPFPLRSNFLQAPLESGLFYRNILCGEKCCLTATADWIGRLGRGIGGGLPQMGGSPFYFLVGGSPFYVPSGNALF